MAACEAKRRSRFRLLVQCLGIQECIRARYRSPALVTTPQTIADVSRSSEISTWESSLCLRRVRNDLQEAPYHRTRSYGPIIDAYRAAACIPVSAIRKVVPRCQFCWFATLSERCDGHRSKIHWEGCPFLRASFVLSCAEAMQQWNGSSLPRSGFFWPSQWVLSWRSG